MPYIPPSLRSSATATAPLPKVPFFSKTRDPKYSGLSGLASGGTLQEAPFARGVSFLDPVTKKVTSSSVWDDDMKRYRPLSSEERDAMILRNLVLRANRLGPRRREAALAEIERRGLAMSEYADTGAADLVQTHYRHSGRGNGAVTRAGPGSKPAPAVEAPAPLFHPDL